MSVCEEVASGPRQKAGHSKISLKDGCEALVSAALSGYGIEYLMHDSGGSPSLHRLADVPYLEMSQVNLSIGASYSEVAQLADGIEGSVVVSAVCILTGAGRC
jgi:hypothetical protein